MPGKTVSPEELAALRMLLRQYDKISARYKSLPSTDQGLCAMDDMQAQLIQFVRDLTREDGNAHAAKAQEGGG